MNAKQKPMPKGIVPLATANRVFQKEAFAPLKNWRFSYVPSLRRYLMMCPMARFRWFDGSTLHYCYGI